MGYIRYIRKMMSLRIGQMSEEIADTARPYLTLGYLSMVLIVASDLVKVKVRSYIARYPVHRTAQSALHFTPWQTCSFQGHLNFFGKYSATLQLLREGYSFTYPPLSVLPGTHLYSWVNCGNVGWSNLPKVRSDRSGIWNRVLSIESPAF